MPIIVGWLTVVAIAAAVPVGLAAGEWAVRKAGELVKATPRLRVVK